MHISVHWLSIRQNSSLGRVEGTLLPILILSQDLGHSRGIPDLASILSDCGEYEIRKEQANCEKSSYGNVLMLYFCALNVSSQAPVF